MFKKLYNNSRFEETLGVMGLFYVILLAVVSVFLIKFLVDTTQVSFVPGESSGSSIAQFELTTAEPLVAQTSTQL